MKQIICLSHEPWGTRPNRTQQLLARLTEAQILFFEPPGARRSQEPADGLRVRSNITVYSLPALLLNNADQNWVRRRNQARIARCIQSVMARHRFREPVLWCTTPENYFMLDHLAYRCLVYDCHQEWDDLPLDWESDLTADDGMTDYGTATDKIALLSDKLYRMFRGVIPRVDAWCWNLTPWTCDPEYSYSVRSVYSSGAMIWRNAYSGSNGVRPLCYLKSEILVSVPGEDDEEKNVEVAEEDRAQLVLIASDRILNALNEYPVEVWGEALGAAVASLFTSKQDAAQIAQEDKDKAAEV